jgi:ParB-like chromosome segregation protein Spo0J
VLAARIAGLAEVPVLVGHRPTSDAEKLVLQLAENLVREDLTVPDAARALARLKELRPADWLDVARLHGIARRRAYQYLEHLKDPVELQQALIRGDIAEGHAEELRRVPPARLPSLLAEVVSNSLSVSNTRRLIAGDKDAQLDRDERAGETANPPSAELERDAVPRANGTTAGLVADIIAGSVVSRGEDTRPTGAGLRKDKARRERSRRLRLRLERIAAELRNMHVEEVSTELMAVPEIIVQARAARESLDRFIALLERVKLDQAGAMEVPRL